MDNRVVVVGGGASGLTAAIAAAREGAPVTVLEHMDRAGKKILATGNGRCNLTNLDLGPEHYRCGRTGFPGQVLARFTVSDTLAFFDGLGIVTRARGGYIYPNSDQASAVLDVLRMEADRLGVDLRCGCHVKAVTAERNGLAVLTEQGKLKAEAVVLAAGSKAAPKTGSDGSGYEIARGLGHRIVKPLPALVQLRCRGNQYKAVAGVRCEARLTLYGDGDKLAEDTGELQLTDYGISGIPTFQISRFASVALDENRKVAVLIDFLPDRTAAESRTFLNERIRRFGYRTCEELLLGVFNKKLALMLLKTAGIPPELKASGITAGQSEKLLQVLKGYRADVAGTNSYEQAQVCCGGVDAGEINDETMESKLVSGVYFAGELIDVDGICGGYNLQWAWSTGMIAGRCAGKR